MTEPSTILPVEEPAADIASPSGASSDKQKPADPDIRASIAAVLDAESPPKERRAAMRALARAARRQWPLIVASVREAPSTLEPQDQAHQWVLCELAAAHGSAVTDLDLGDREETRGVVRIAIALANSAFVSSPGYPKADKELKPRRRALPGPGSDSLRAHELLATDEDGEWPAQTETVSGFDLLPVKRLIVEHFAEADAPLARELIARDQLVEFRTRGKELSRKQITRLVRGRAVLESLVRKPESALGDTRGSGSDLMRRIRIARFVGRKFEVWAVLDKSRVKLIKAAPQEPGPLERWAELVALTHATSKGAMQAIAELSDEAVVALLGAALRYQLGVLTERLKDSILSRINREEASEALFRGVLRLGREQPDLSRWVRRTIASHVPLGDATDLQEGGEHVLLGKVRAGSITELVERRFLTQVESVPPSFRVVILAAMVNRLEGEIPTRAAARIEEAASAVRRIGAALAAREVDLRRLLASFPAALESALEMARNEITSAADCLLSAAPAPLKPRTFPRIEPLMNGGEDNISECLHQLAFDPSRSDDEWRAARARVQQKLAWVARNDHRMAAQLAEEAATLPPEALGALWEVGVVRREEVLLSTVGATLDSNPIFSEIWADVLLAAAAGDAPVPLEAAIADRSCAILSTRVASLIERVNSPDPIGPTGRASQDAEAAAERALKIVRGFTREVAALAERPLMEER